MEQIMKYSKEEVLQYVIEEDVKFIRLAFSDVFGRQKNISIMPHELKRAFDYGIALDASSIAGFGNEAHSDLFLHPEPDTGAVTNVTVEMGKASAIRVDETTLQSLVEPWGYAEAMAVNMGNPHLVIFVGDALSVPVAEIGQELEHSVLFPTGVNVEFAEVIDRRHILMRVWERGSGITQACGTGACATAVACHWAGLTEAMNQQVTMDGGTLAVSYDPLTSHVTMTGSAVTVFEGEIEV